MSRAEDDIFTRSFLMENLKLIAILIKIGMSLLPALVP